MELQWYPGHMTAARRMMEENLKLIDLLVELVDARIPESSRNPDLEKMGNGKARLIILGKADLADEQATSSWISWYESRGLLAAALDARQAKDAKAVRRKIMEACQEKIERNRRKGILNRPIRVMVTGIPNVGKSTFINSLAGRASAKTGNKPGVTKGKQWISLGKELELLDTPGILWPKFEDQNAALLLAAVGTMRSEILQEEELALLLIEKLRDIRPSMLTGHFGFTDDEPYECLLSYAKSRNCLKAGGEWDTEKAAKLFLSEFRSGRAGRVTLECPKEGFIK